MQNPGSDAGVFLYGWREASRHQNSAVIPGRALLARARNP
jgi:hypothetical protein